ncbi:hypothetical protein BSKO_03733 [Bryopsis sp. KO-2023]|nr:hypothetical protein BSKO_03733 [Bryopsis sp. KO-2023]
MKVLSEATDARRFSRDMRRSGKTIGFVPTMGFLHEGHLSLIKLAREHADIVVASIYINPLQFSANEDFDEYPRDAEGDRQKLEEAGCAMVFEPKSLYSGVSDASHVIGAASEQTHQTIVQVEQLEKPLCGQSRPHFFRGVATVVAKLFNIMEPDVAVFGSKDYQQGKVISRMTKDLDFPIKIVMGPIFREQDGLAMSSRNARLDPGVRSNTIALFQSLKWAKSEVKTRKATSPDDLRKGIEEKIAASGGDIDYVEVVDAETLDKVGQVGKEPLLIAVAVFFPAKDGDRVRLIDNIVIE